MHESYASSHPWPPWRGPLPPYGSGSGTYPLPPDEALPALLEHTRRLVHEALAHPCLPFVHAKVPNGVVLTFAPSPPKANTLAHYAPGRWTNGKGIAPEVNVDARRGLSQGPISFIDSILHELCHHAQYTTPKASYPVHTWDAKRDRFDVREAVIGKPARPPRHNKQWGALANACLLKPVLPKGFHDGHGEGAASFYRAAFPWIFEATIPWRFGLDAARSKGKMKLWTCACSPPIRLRVGRAEIHVKCLDCDTEFEEAE